MAREHGEYAGRLLPLGEHVVPDGKTGADLALANRVTEFKDRELARGTDHALHIGHPDLTVAGVVVPPNATSGTTIPVEWSVQNLGTTAAAGAWTDYVYLSSDGLLDTGDPLVGQVGAAGPVLPGAGYTRQFNWVIPIELAGDWHVFVRADALSQVNEVASEDNNVLGSPGTLARGSRLPSTATSISRPARRAISSRLRRSTSTVPPPTVPRPSRPTRIGFI